MVRRSRCRFPSCRIDRHNRRDLPRVSDEDKPLRDLAEQHEVGPLHLPCLLHEHDIEWVRQLNQTPLRGRANNNALTAWQLIFVFHDLNALRNIGNAASASESRGIKMKVVDKPSTDVVCL